MSNIYTSFDHFHSECHYVGSDRTPDEHTSSSDPASNLQADGMCTTPGHIPYQDSNFVLPQELPDTALLDSEKSSTWVNPRLLQNPRNNTDDYNYNSPLVVNWTSANRLNVATGGTSENRTTDPGGVSRSSTPRNGTPRTTFFDLNTGNASLVGHNLRSSIEYILNSHLDTSSAVASTKPWHTHHVVQLANLAREYVGNWEMSVVGQDTYENPRSLSANSFSNWNDQAAFGRSSQSMDMDNQPAAGTGSTVNSQQLQNTTLDAPPPFPPQASGGRSSSSKESFGKQDVLPCILPDCKKVLKGVYHWKRHQASHFGPWICMPERKTTIDGYCAICGERDISDAHRDTHLKLDACLEKSPGHSFRGRDKLEDHLKVHLGWIKLSDSAIARRRVLLGAWKSKIDSSPAALWCGFCRSSCSSWETRLNHVLEHLKEGTSVADWALMGSGMNWSISE